jgi:hypothetical protein
MGVDVYLAMRDLAAREPCGLDPEDVVLREVARHMIVAAHASLRVAGICSARLFSSGGVGPDLRNENGGVVGALLWLDKVKRARPRSAAIPLRLPWAESYINQHKHRNFLVMGLEERNGVLCFVEERAATEKELKDVVYKLWAKLLGCDVGALAGKHLTGQAPRHLLPTIAKLVPWPEPLSDMLGSWAQARIPLAKKPRRKYPFMSTHYAEGSAVWAMELELRQELVTGLEHILHEAAQRNVSWRTLVPRTPAQGPPGFDFLRRLWAKRGDSFPLGAPSRQVEPVRKRRRTDTDQGATREWPQRGGSTAEAVSGSSSDSDDEIPLAQKLAGRARRPRGPN